MCAAILALTIECFAPTPADDSPTYGGKRLGEWLSDLHLAKSKKRYRPHLMEALEAFGPAAEAAVPDLIDMLKEGVPLRPSVTDVLASIGPKAEAAIPILIARIRARDPEKHWDVPYPEIHALAGIGAPAVPALIKLLEGTGIVQRESAVLTLTEIGQPAQAAVPSLIHALQAHGPEDRPSLILNAFRAIGPGAIAAASLLDSRLSHHQQDPDRFTIDELARTLDRVGSPPVATLLDLFFRDVELGGEAAWDYLAAGFALGDLGAKAKGAIPRLRAALSDERREFRAAAAMALAQIDPNAKEALDVLIYELEHPWRDRENVHPVLARLGPAAAAAIPALMREAKDVDNASDALDTLAYLDPEGKACVPTLITALKSDDWGIVLSAARSIRLLGPHAKDAVPALAIASARTFRTTRAEDPQIAAVKALGRIGPGPGETLPVLIAALAYRRPASVQNDWVHNTSDPTAVAEAAARVLASFGPDAEAAVPALIGALTPKAPDNHDVYFLCKEAARALGHIGPAAHSAIPVLEDAANQGVPGIREAAIVSLSRIEQDGGGRIEGWLATTTDPAMRAALLDAVGWPSVEADTFTLKALKLLNGYLDEREFNGLNPEDLGGCFEEVGRFGVAGGRLAIRKLEQLRSDTDPWVRMLADDTLRFMRAGH